MASYSNARKRGRTKMKHLLWRGALAAAIALPALSGIARAESTGCTNATLKGDYAFSVIDNDSPPLVAVGIGTFDGKGGFSQIDYRGDSLGLDPAATNFVGPETGSYQVNPNCTGSQVVDLGVVVVENRFVISDGGRAIHAVVARARLPDGTVLHGQTRVEFWTVGSAKDK
jgi:hypothetical protein